MAALGNPNGTDNGKIFIERENLTLILRVTTSYYENLESVHAVFGVLHGYRHERGPFTKPFAMPSRYGVRKIFAAFGTAFVLLCSQPAAAHRASDSASTFRTLLEEEHDHDHAKVDLPKCACLAAAEGWKIDCSATAAMNNALTYLETTSNNCKTKDHSAECEKNFNIINAHHDHCDHGEVPEEIEKEIHEFEGFYTDCQIEREWYTLGGVCDEVHCEESGTKAELTDAINALETNNCNATASSCKEKKACKDAFQKILMAHDTCDHDDVPTEIEKALHDYEDACDSIRCNTATKAEAENSLICSGAAAATTRGAFLLAAIAVASTLAAA